MHTFVRAPTDTTGGWAQACMHNMNEFGWLRSGAGAIKGIRAYLVRAKRALPAIDCRMTPLILADDVLKSDLDLWNARYTDCQQRLGRMEELLATGHLSDDDWHATLSTIACTEATIVGALATLSIHGITLRIQPRLPDKGQ